MSIFSGFDGGTIDVEPDEALEVLPDLLEGVELRDEGDDMVKGPYKRLNNSFLVLGAKIREQQEERREKARVGAKRKQNFEAKRENINFHKNRKESFLSSWTANKSYA